MPPLPLKPPPSEAIRPGLPDERIFIALGSNLGERKAWLHFALAAFKEAPFLRQTALSPIVETQAVVLPTHPPQPPYLNAVAEVSCSLSPLELLRFLLETEARAGRNRQERWGARTLDLDILCFGSRQVCCPEFILPHPRLHLRAFVLSPWAHIAPEWVPPGQGLSIAALYARLA